MADFTIGQGDTAPTLYGTLTRSDGTAYDLTTASGVRFQMRVQTSMAYAVDADAVIATPASGLVRYEWAPGDTADAGDYYASWEITWSDGTVQHTEPANTVTVAAT
jgi:hypothetical protein